MLRLAGEPRTAPPLTGATPSGSPPTARSSPRGQERRRDPSEVAIIEYIRICVDDDVDAARRAYVKALMGYAMARPGRNKEFGYRGHFARMGFDEQLTELEDRRDRGASEAELVDAFPVDLALQVGYFGPASGAAAAFRRLAEGLDTAIVRVVAARPGSTRSRPSWKPASPPGPEAEWLGGESSIPTRPPGERGAVDPGSAPRADARVRRGRRRSTASRSTTAGGILSGAAAQPPSSSE